jgi:hypothetical protein
MELLKAQIASTIYQPDFLREFKAPVEVKDMVYTLCFEILDLYYKGVRPNFLQNRSIKSLCYKIDNLSWDLGSLISPELMLQIWLWIGTTVETWIDFAFELEIYEVVSNLKKILHAEYV